MSHCHPWNSVTVICVSPPLWLVTGMANPGWRCWLGSTCFLKPVDVFGTAARQGEAKFVVEISVLSETSALLGYFWLAAISFYFVGFYFVLFCLR